MNRLRPVLALLFVGSIGLSLLGCTQQTSTTAAGAVPEPSSSSSISPNGNTSHSNTSHDSSDAGWQEINPAGETLCSDGSAYKFWVHEGDPTKVVFYLQGGGACWFRGNCDPAMQPSYNINLERTHPKGYQGIFDSTKVNNPLAEHTKVFVPYCSGDVHLGASDTVYAPAAPGQKPLTIFHRGLANAGSALAWTYANLPGAQEIFVTGSSAGAIPSPYYAMKLAKQYPGAAVRQLGDGAGGYRRSATQAAPNEQWGTVAALREEPGFEDLTDANFNYEQLYIRAARQQPRIQFARYDAAEDAVQKRFLALSGVERASLIDSLTANAADIGAVVPRFAGYIAGGDSHTILGRAEFYEYKVGARSVRDWVADLADGRPVASHRCENCLLPEFVSAPTPEALRDLWLSWEDPKQQVVAPFKIFDNLYYVGIDWVAAYVLKTSDGLILIDTLYGKWVDRIYSNMRSLGLDPAAIKYVLVTHGHFDHSGGAYDVQRRYGAKVAMAAEDWELMAQPAEHPLFAQRLPKQDIVIADGDHIQLGDTRVDFVKTPGHTTGVLSMRYEVRDGDERFNALTLGGVGLNFSGVERTEAYIASYKRLQTLQREHSISVSVPNHAAMGKVFQRQRELAQRQTGQPHPFVDAQRFAADLALFLERGEEKLLKEQNGTAIDPMEELTKVIAD